MARPAVDVVIDPPPIVAATRPLQRRVTLGGPGYACTPNPPDVHPKTSLLSCVPTSSCTGTPCTGTSRPSSSLNEVTSVRSRTARRWDNREPDGYSRFQCQLVLRERPR